MRILSGLLHQRPAQARTIAKIRSLTHTTVRNPLPATFLRGGTSKGIFLKRSDLPENSEGWTPIFQGIMGSPDPQHRRQLNGMGGGVSSLSKVCVVGPPSADRNVEVEYTFVQVGVDDGALDFSGNCGNLSSMIGVFAVDEGMCTPKIDESTGLATVRSYNTNTSKRIDTTFPVSQSGSPVLDRSEVEVAGVPAKASRIVLQFVNPGGARTGQLLPSGSPVDFLQFAGEEKSLGIAASLVDATNPTVFIAAAGLSFVLGLTSGETLSTVHYTKPYVEETLERIRQSGAMRMGLDPSAKAQPKIAVLSEPTSPEDAAAGVDIVIHAFSMGVLHKAVPMTVGLCLGVAAGMQGTLAREIMSNVRSKRGDAHDRETIRIRHPGGLVEVGAQFGEDGNVLSAQVVRTGRRLMKGVVWW